MTKAWNHQPAMIDFALERPAAVINGGMGTGKSFVAVHVLATEDRRRVVILCPKAVLGVWRREVAKHWPGEPPRVLVLDRGTGKRKSEQLESFTEGVVVINYESAWRKPLADSLVKFAPDAVVCDESHRIKSHSGKASKFAAKLGTEVPRKLCLTGTLLPHSPLDAYAQFRFINPLEFGRSYTAFRARYAVTDRMYPSRVLKWINQEDLSQRIDKYTIRVRSEDVLDLDEIHHRRIDVRLDATAAKAYRDLEQDLVTEIDGGLITATNALAKLLRLQQVTSGVVAGVRVGTEKIDALADRISDIPADEPVVVFGRFVSDLDAARCVADITRRNYGEISGRRRDLTEHATMPEGIGLMGVQIQAGGTGIDLTRSAYAAYLSVGFSLGDYDQSIARLHRPGQTRPVQVDHFVAERTVDEHVYQALDERRDLIESVLGNLSHADCYATA